MRTLYVLEWVWFPIKEEWVPVVLNCLSAPAPRDIYYLEHWVKRFNKRYKKELFITIREED